MKRFLNGKTTGLVVMLSCMFLAISCVNNDYELSEDKINTDVTIFQEGLTLPLGTTAPIKMGDLYGMLDPELQEIIQNKDGKYGFSYTGSVDLTDSLAFAKEMFAIDALSVKENFEFNLSNVNLDGLVIDESRVKMDPVDVSSMLSVPNIALPEVKEELTVKTQVKKPDVANLNLDFASLNMEHHAEFSSLNLNDTNKIPDLSKNPLYDWSAPMEYTEWTKLASQYGLSLPEMSVAVDFEEVKLEVPVRISLPSAIQNVKNIELHKDANIDLDIKVVNPLFIEGKIIPHIDIDLHTLFHVDYLSSGVVDDLTQHIKDDFVLSAPTWEADHVYHVDALALTSADWKKVGEELVLDKTFEITLSGTLANEDLKTSLQHLYEHGNEPMDIVVSVKFNNFTIENVEMDIAPISITETVNVPVNVPAVALPDMIADIDYVGLKNDLNLSMTASLPAALENLDVKLESLEVEFPDGFEVEHDGFENGKLSYSNISLNDAADFADQIKISRLNLPDPVGGTLSYNGEVKVTAKATASGTVNSRELLSDAMAGDIDIKVNVDYAPALDDFSVTTSDYVHKVEVAPISFSEELPEEVGKLNKVLVYLEGDPKIKVNLNYPTAGGAISLIPDKTEGLKVYFPQMLKFKSLPSSDYRYDSESNSISFIEGRNIPKYIELPIDRLEFVPVHKEGGYFIEGEIKVEGGVCLAATTVSKSVIDALKNDKAEISMEAVVSKLKPATLALDQYVASVSESVEFEIPVIEGIPEMIDIKSIDAFDLEDVYLNFSIDASSIMKILGDVQVDLDFDVTVPDIIKMGNGIEGNVFKIKGQVNEDNKYKFEIEPIHIRGFDLSKFDFTSDVIDLGTQKVSIDGGVTLSDLSIDLAELENADLNVAVEASLATKGTDLIKLDKVQAKVDCKFEFDETFDLSSLTEQIGDKLDFMIDFNRFHLDFDLKTNLTLPVQLSELKVVPYKGGVAGEPMQIDEPIALNTNTTGEVTHSKIRISNLESDKHEDPEYHHVVLDLLSLVKDMPDSIQLHLNAGTKDNATFAVDPSTDYVLAADYAFELPLELGEEFKIEFTDTLKGLPSVLHDVLAVGSLGLSGEVINSFPLALDLEFQLLDVEGNAVPMADNAGHQTIKAGNLDGSPVTTQLNVVLGVQKGIEIPQIDAVKLIFRATSSGAGLAEDNFIQVQLNALIPEGVSVDLKELMGTPSDPEIQK